MQTLAVAGDVLFGPATNVVLGYQQDNFNYPTVQSAYVKEQRVVEGHVTQRWRGWSAMFGVRSKENDRLRGQQNFVDVPHWLQFEGRINGRINKQLRLTVRGYTEDMSRLPPMITEDARSLDWEHRSFAQVKLDGFRDNFNYYVIGSYNRRENSTRSIGITNRAVTAGANWDATPGLSMFLEYTRDAWWGSGGEPVRPRVSTSSPQQHANSRRVWMDRLRLTTIFGRRTRTSVPKTTIRSCSASGQRPGAVPDPQLPAPASPRAPRSDSRSRHGTIATGFTRPWITAQPP